MTEIKQILLLLSQSNTRKQCTALMTTKGSSTFPNGKLWWLLSTVNLLESKNIKRWASLRQLVRDFLLLLEVRAPIFMYGILLLWWWFGMVVVWCDGGGGGGGGGSRGRGGDGSFGGCGGSCGG